MQYTYDDYIKARDAIRDRIGDCRPEMLLILGSGLGFLADEAETPIYVPYGEIPGFKSSTAPGHNGRLVFGRFCGKKAVFMVACKNFSCTENIRYSQNRSFPRT